MHVICIWWRWNPPHNKVNRSITHIGPEESLCKIDDKYMRLFQNFRDFAVLLNGSFVSPLHMSGGHLEAPEYWIPNHMALNYWRKLLFQVSWINCTLFIKLVSCRLEPWSSDTHFFKKSIASACMFKSSDHLWICGARKKKFPSLVLT